MWILDRSQIALQRADLMFGSIADRGRRLMRTPCMGAGGAVHSSSLSRPPQHLLQPPNARLPCRLHASTHGNYPGRCGGCGCSLRSSPRPPRRRASTFSCSSRPTARSLPCRRKHRRRRTRSEDRSIGIGRIGAIRSLDLPDGRSIENPHIVFARICMK